MRLRPTAQVTFLYSRIGLRVSHALGEAQGTRPEGCVSSADLKPWVFPEKSEVREVLTVARL